MMKKILNFLKKSSDIYFLLAIILAAVLIAYSIIGFSQLNFYLRTLTVSYPIFYPAKLLPEEVITPEEEPLVPEEELIAEEPSASEPSPPQIIEELPPQISEEQKEKMAPGEIIIRFKEDFPKIEKGADGYIQTGAASLDKLMERWQVYDLNLLFSPTKVVSEEELEERNLTRVYNMSFNPSFDPERAASEFSEDPLVDYAHPNFAGEFQFAPNDEFYPQQWAHKKTQAELAWDIEQGKPEIVIAVLDTGVDLEHPDLKDNIWINTAEANGVPGVDDDNNGFVDDIYGWDFHHKDNDPRPAPWGDGYEYHGTEVAGVIGARINNKVGVAGVCGNCRLMIVRLDPHPFPYTVLPALYYAINNGARIINMSWWTQGQLGLLEEVINLAASKNILLVAAVDNELPQPPPGAPEFASPANYNEVIAVVGTTQLDERAPSPGFGPAVSIAAPDGHYTTSVDSLGESSYNPWAGGNSFATAYISGTLGLILSKNPSLSAKDARKILEYTADKIYPDYYVGSGRVNVFKALSWDKPPPAFATIKGPFGLEYISGPRPIHGTAIGEGYKLEYQKPGDSTWTLIKEGSSLVDAPLGIFDPRGLSSGDYIIRLTAQSGTYKDEDRITLTYDASIPGPVHYQPGWPQIVPEHFLAPPTFADIDNDGDLEILAVSQYPAGVKLFVWHHTGVPAQGWPKSLVAYFPGTTPTVGDIDGDGDVEIILTAQYGFYRKAYALHHDGSFVKGWPLLLKHSVDIRALANFDDDKALEIIGMYSNKIYVWNGDGSNVPGWPRTAVGYRALYPAVADIDGDGMPEIAVSTDRGGYLFNHDGTLFSDKWPVLEVGKLSPVIADLDQDGDYEIVMGDLTNVYILDINGNILSQMAKNKGEASFSLGDLDKDGDLEILTASDDGYIYAWHHDGKNVSGWPVFPNAPGKTPIFMAPPAIGDLNRDGKPEIIIGSRSAVWKAVGKGGGYIYVWHNDGTPASSLGFPLKLFDAETLSTPALADIDGDGDIELIVVTKNIGCTWAEPCGIRVFSVYVWDFPGRYDSRNVYWDRFRHDQFNTGSIVSPVVPIGPSPPSISSFSLSNTSLTVGDTLEFTISWSDPNTPEKVKAYICKTSSFNTSTKTCNEGTWVSSADFTDTSPIALSYATASGDVGTQSAYAFVCDDEGLCSSYLQKSFTVTVPQPSYPPAITSFSLSPTSLSVGDVLTFSVSWQDQNSPEKVKAYICKTSSFNTSTQTCPGGSWASSVSFTSFSTVNLDYTPTSQDQGTNYAYAFVCDDEGLCSDFKEAIFKVVLTTTLTLTSQDSPDWVSTSFQNNRYYKSKTTYLAVSKYKAKSLIKFDISKIPQGAIINSAQFYFYPQLTAAGTTISLDYVSDDSWSFSQNSAESLWGWPTLHAISNWPSGGYKWETVDITQELQKEINNLDTTLSFKWDYLKEGVLIQYYSPKDNPPNGPYIEVTYSTSITSPVPSITSLAITPQALTAGNALTFSVAWQDQDSPEKVKAYICKTSSFNTSTKTCNEGTWVFSPSFTSTSPIILTYTTTSQDVGTNNAYAFVCDDEGLCSSYSQGSFTVTAASLPDTTPPTGTITIENGAKYTNSRNITLTLSATDSEGTVTQMKFSNDNVNYSSPESYQTTKSWTLSSGDGTKTVYVKYKDNSNNWSGLFSDTIVLDTTSPTISNVSASNIGQNSAKISWQTDEPATSQVKYGMTPAYGSQTTLDTNLATSHSQTLTGLSAGTLYNYRVISKDAANNESLSINYTFTTQPLPDTTPPSKITNLTTSNITETSADLSWTSPGDDANSGTAYQYDIRYSTSPITEDNWNQATQVTGEPTPQVAGTSQFFTLVGLSPSTTYYFAIKTSDEVPNWSELSNIVSATTLSPPPQALSVSLSANPSSGTAPLNNVDLTATVSGTAQGNINYTFYCNRSDTSTNITPDYVKKVDNIDQNPYTALDICNYSSAGQYSPKVIVERDNLVAEVRIALFVTETPPPPPPGGGGGGGYIPPASDAIPPQPATDFEAQAGDSQVLLSWKNPTDSDFVRVIILRKLNSYPTSPTEGEIVYEGKETSFIDTDLINGKAYYYSIFAYDKIPNYSQRATASAAPKTEKPISEMTIEELKARIAQILALIAALKAQIAQLLGVPEIPADYKFTRPLYIGLRNTDVRYLQIFFKAQEKDIYPQGLITSYFGPLTRAAVIKFQVKYGIVATSYSPGAGLVGIKTRAKINEILGR
jgi:hypothetical protein